MHNFDNVHNIDNCLGVLFELKSSIIPYIIRFFSIFIVLIKNVHFFVMHIVSIIGWEFFIETFNLSLKSALSMGLVKRFYVHNFNYVQNIDNCLGVFMKGKYNIKLDIHGF